ncbi:hypothetical protein ADA01nite_30350 [Aneurinibacillus danicus]|uniref:Uncharacterized protein n=1 Tax=Aneurinibacillus danicus TaxID=267746 RepID=A0A511V9G6_9BACL|nr:hypothetical protein ADA01nite_30350 [Aneurinibacillus danicus]
MLGIRIRDSRIDNARNPDQSCRFRPGFIFGIYPGLIGVYAVFVLWGNNRAISFVKLR